MRKILKEIYMEWVNDFLSLEGFANYYALEVSDAEKLLQVARKVYYEETELKK